MKSQKGKTMNVGGQKKVEAVQKIVVKEERRKASAQAQAYAEYMVCPYDAPNVVHAPSPVPVRETTIRQNLVVDLATFNAGGGFNIEVRPHLTDTLSVTSSAVDTQDAGSFTLDMSWQGVGNLAVTPDVGEATHMTTGTQANFRNIIAPGNGSVRYAVPFSTTGFSETFNLTLQASSSESCLYLVSYETLANGGNWTAAGTSILYCTSEGGTVTASVILPANCIGLAISALQTTFTTYKVPMSLGIAFVASTGTGLTGLARLSSTVSTFGLPLATSVAQLQSWRVTAQDLLVTFEGDTLNDGGNIAAARVTSHWTGGKSDASGNPYADIIALPYDRYDGPLKLGAHVHWIPGSIDDLKPIEDIKDDADFGYFKMVAAGTITHPGASVRVRVCTTIAYFSNDPSYGEMDWAPPPTDLGLMLQYVARVVPAATENDTHILKKIAAFAGKNLNTGIKYLQENPQLLTKLATMLLASL
jgi:hypothetical protein